MFFVEAPSGAAEVIAAYSTSNPKLLRGSHLVGLEFLNITFAVELVILPCAKQMHRNKKINKYHRKMQYDLDRNIQILTS